MQREALMYKSLKLGMALAAILPPRVGYALSTMVGVILYYLLKGPRGAVRSNMRRVLGRKVSRRKLSRISRDIFRNSVKNYYDLLRLPNLKPRDIEQMVHVYGDEHLAAALAGGHGLILCGAHIGNFNLMMQVAGARGYKISVVAEQLSSPKIDELVSGLRASFGIKLIHTGPQLVRGIYRALRAGEMLALAMDRDITHNGAAVEVFGSPAVLPTGPVTLSLRLGAPFLPMRMRRENNNSTSVWIYPPLEWERTGNNERDIELGMQQMARLLEEFVLSAPDQWVVTQPVWAADGGEPIPSPGFAALSRAEAKKTEAAKLPSPDEAKTA